MSLVFSIGSYGGFYLHPHRICFGWFAITWMNIEIDELIRGYNPVEGPCKPL